MTCQSETPSPCRLHVSYHPPHPTPPDPILPSPNSIDETTELNGDVIMQEGGSGPTTTGAGSEPAVTPPTQAAPTAAEVSGALGAQTVLGVCLEGGFWFLSRV